MSNSKNFKNNKMNFDFLSTVTVKNEKTKRVATPKLPLGLALRVFATGAVYPSEELVAKYDLEYQNKSEDKNAYVGNGFDIILSTDWAAFPADAPQAYLFIASAPKALPRIDLFGQCSYNEDGTPKATVTAQGSSSFGKKYLVPMVEKVFGITLEKGQYVDLVINTEVSIPSEDGIFYIPKPFTRGEKAEKGMMDIVRRENIVINPLTAIASTEEPVEAEETVENDAEYTEAEDQANTNVAEDTMPVGATEDTATTEVPETPTPEAPEAPFV